jgi:hypothetical protein
MFCKFASKIIMFQEALQFHFTIMLLYGKHTTMGIINQMPPPLTWQISHIIADCLSPTVSSCLLDQARGHLLLNDALHFTSSMS